MKKLLKTIRDIILLVFRNLFLRLFLHHTPINKKYDVSICSIFKNESDFLQEWIEYHLLIGIEHFYLYDNESEDKPENVLQPYIDRGIVSLKPWAGKHAQMSAYKDFYDSYRDETQWVSFLDIDEFICPNNKTNIRDWLKTYRKYPAILIYWKMFGTSGQMRHDATKLVIEQYHVAWSGLYKVGKCIINTKYDISKFDAFTHHCPHIKYSIMGLRFNIRPINQFKLFITPDNHLSWLYNEDNCSIQINHYWSKAWDIYEKKMKMTDVYYKDNPKKNISYFYMHEERNDSVDYKIYKYLIRLKQRIKMLENNKS